MQATPGKCSGSSSELLRLTDGGDGGDDLAQLELVKNGSFTSSVKSNLQRCRNTRESATAPETGD